MDIERRIKDMLSEQCDEETIDNETKLQEDLNMDSLSLVMLLVNLEETFGIELDESDMNPFDLITVQDVADMVKKYRVEEND